MIQFLIIFIGLIIFSYFLEKFLISIIGSRLFRLLVIPGIIIHELSHAIIALIFGAKIKKFHVLKADGGEVQYTKPVLPIISNPLISMAPVLGASVSLYYIGILLGFDYHFSLQFSWFDFSNFLKFFQNDFIKSMILLYFILSITASIAPSKPDFKNAFAGLLLYLAAFVAIYHFFPASNTFFIKMSYYYLIGVYMLILAFAAAIILWFIKTLIVNRLNS